MHLRFNRLFTAALRADSQAPPTADQTTPPVGCVFLSNRYFWLSGTD